MFRNVPFSIHHAIEFCIQVQWRAREKKMYKLIWKPFNFMHIIIHSSLRICRHSKCWTLMSFNPLFLCCCCWKFECVKYNAPMCLIETWAAKWNDTSASMNYAFQMQRTDLEKTKTTFLSLSMKCVLNAGTHCYSYVVFLSLCLTNSRSTF